MPVRTRRAAAERGRPTGAVSGRALATWIAALAIGAVSSATATAAPTVESRPAPAPPPADRVLEMVSPVDKGGQPIDHTLQVADDDGERGGVLMQSLGAFGDVQVNTGATFYRARRGATGWETVGMQPPPAATIPGSAHSPVFFAADGMLDELVQETQYPQLPEMIRPGTGRWNVLRVGAHGAFSWLSSAVAPDGTYGVARVAGVSRDAQHVFMRIQSSTGQLSRSYVRDGDRMVDVGIGPDGAPLPDTRPVGDVRVSAGISADGQTVVFTAGTTTYVRRDALRPNGTTSIVGRSQRAGAPTGTACVNGQFFGMSDDGRRILLSCTVPLTDDAPATGRSLYEYDVAADSLVYRSPGPQLNGFVSLGSSPDLRRVFLYRATGSTLAVVEDGIYREVLTAAGIGPNPVVATSRNGERLAFVSTAGLDGGYAGRQMYVYDAANGPEGSLTCVSCRAGESSGGTALFGTRDVDSPAPVRDALTASFTADGSSFYFMSTAALTPEAPEGPASVYEYRDGRVRLMVAGAVEAEATDTTPVRYADARFAGVSSQGTDVFVITRQSLLPQDDDAPVPDLYTFRRGGGFPPDPVCQNCTPPAPPDLGGPRPEPVLGSTLLVPPTQGAVPPPAPPRRPATPRPQVVSRQARGTTVRLRVRARVAGTLRVTGNGLRRANRRVTRSGTYTLNVRLTPHGRRTLERRGRLQVRPLVRLAPRQGRASSTRTTLTITRAARRAS